MPRQNVEAPMPGKILKVNTSPGSHVNKGDAICVLESMKMENLVLAPVSGTVQEVNVAPDQIVRFYEVVAVIEY